MKNKYLIISILFVTVFLSFNRSVDAGRTYKTGGEWNITVSGHDEHSYVGTLYTEMIIPAYTNPFPINRVLVDANTVENIVKDLVNNDKFSVEIDSITHRVYVYYGCDNYDSLKFIMNFNTHSLSKSTYKKSFQTAANIKVESDSPTYFSSFNVMEGGQAGKDLFYVDGKYSVRALANALGSVVTFTSGKITLVGAPILKDLPDKC